MARPSGTRRLLLDATTRDLRKYRAELAQQEKPASVTAAAATLRRFYGWAAEIPYSRRIQRSFWSTSSRSSWYPEALPRSIGAGCDARVRQARSSAASAARAQRGHSLPRRPLGRRANVNHAHPHRFRYDTCRRLVGAVDLTTVAPWLGHERMDTVRIYSQPDEAALERAGRALEDK